MTVDVISTNQMPITMMIVDKMTVYEMIVDATIVDMK